MSQLHYQVPQPVQQETGAQIFDIDGEEARVAYMKALGARNMDPPLVRSTHLKIKASGRVLPYDEMLAEQGDLVQNCDQFGNTDPAVWGPQVVHVEVDPDAQRLAMAKAQEAILSQAAQMTSHGRQPQLDPAKPLPVDYPPGVIAVADIQNLHTLLES